MQQFLIIYHTEIVDWKSATAPNVTHQENIFSQLAKIKILQCVMCCPESKHNFCPESKPLCINSVNLGSAYFLSSISNCDDILIGDFILFIIADCCSTCIISEIFVEKANKYVIFFVYSWFKFYAKFLMKPLLTGL